MFWLGTVSVRMAVATVKEVEPGVTALLCTVLHVCQAPPLKEHDWYCEDCVKLSVTKDSDVSMEYVVTAGLKAGLITPSDVTPAIVRGTTAKGNTN